MLVFGNRYINLRKNFIFPLLSYKVDYGKLKYNNIKEILPKYKSVSILSNTRYELFFNEDDLLKAVIGEYEYFYTRSIIQYGNLLKANSHLDPTWSMVTQYYFNFFSVTACLRLLRRGNIYLDPEKASLLTNSIRATTGNFVTLNKGNYTFSIDKVPLSSDLKLVLNQTSNGSHEQLWITAYSLILELLLDATKDDEFTILTNLKSMSSPRDGYGINFPSQLRNAVNYQPKYGVHSLNKEIIVDIKNYSIEDLVQEILQFKKIESENHKIRISGVYGFYFFVLLSNLYSEIVERGHTCRKLHDERKDYLKRMELDIPKFPLIY